MTIFSSVLLAAFLWPAAPTGEVPDTTAFVVAPADTSAPGKELALRLDSLLQAPPVEELRALLPRFLQDDCRWDAMDPGMVHVPDTTAAGLIGRILPSRSTKPRGRVVSPCIGEQREPGDGR